ncbi:MAG TPA: benzoate-CoA ligase family protein [Stellaceae bacterium]|nr:benzoate-CoA ligase family protein [Stellaceae bacterium]
MPIDPSGPLDPSGHLDTFARDHLPPRELWPVMEYGTVPELDYPRRLNAAVELLDRMVENGHRDRACLRTNQAAWTYGDLLEKANRIANVLVRDLGLVPGNRVLLRAANTPMLVASWFAVLKAGGIAVATMPLLRVRELNQIMSKAYARFSICDSTLRTELDNTVEHHKGQIRTMYFNTDAADGLEARMRLQPASFENVVTSHDDVALIAFTSGTTGVAKGTMHFHRDVLAVCDTFPPYVLKPRVDDIFLGSPPLAFTFGLGGLVLFPMRVGASTFLLEKPSPDALLETVARHRATVLFTAPTAYRTMADKAGQHDLKSLRECVSAGETLPPPVFEAFRRATGIRIIDGIGSTELLHIFISAARDEIRPGATGKPVPGYRAEVVDDNGDPVPPDTVGRLAVRGPTGCRYLDNLEQQQKYVRNGWNLTGDAYRRDPDGYYWYQARTDDMIISAGYNISGPEVEAALLDHPKVLECAVVGSPDTGRGEIVKAFVVLRPGSVASDALVEDIQNFAKAEIAPYKYPRSIEFVPDLPRTETGKVQRFKLREFERERARQKTGH